MVYIKKEFRVGVSPVYGDGFCLLSEFDSVGCQNSILLDPSKQSRILAIQRHVYIGKLQLAKLVKTQLYLQSNMVMPLQLVSLIELFPPGLSCNKALL